MDEQIEDDDINTASTMFGGMIEYTSLEILFLQSRKRGRVLYISGITSLLRSLSIKDIDFDFLQHVPAAIVVVT
jgi:hypothetical protein